MRQLACLLLLASSQLQGNMAMALRPVILGSKSATRFQIMQEMGYEPIVRSADIDERSIGDRLSEPSALVLELGLAKADALLPQLKAEGASCLLLTGDQVVVHEGRVLEKPTDAKEVKANIAGFARSPCKTVGSAVITDLATGKQVHGVDSAEIYFSKVPDAVVDELCAQGTVLHCAGGLMVEHPLIQPYLQEIKGDIDSVMGLSKALVKRLMDQVQQA
ncbi:unnamed protein product [Chrysoparadoxa australica]